jgi:hypothetical protein
MNVLYAGPKSADLPTIETFGSFSLTSLGTGWRWPSRPFSQRAVQLRLSDHILQSFAETGTQT